MSRNRFAKSYEELIVYEKARELSRRVYALTKSFPKEETYSLTDQIRRSSRSVGAQIAEAWAKRRYPRHFVSKLTDADGEKNETGHWIDVAYDSGLLVKETAGDIKSLLDEIGRMLQGMINRADDFRGDDHRSIREADASYEVPNEFFLNTEN